jgi:hypothetical protein
LFLFVAGCVLGGGFVRAPGVGEVWCFAFGHGLPPVGLLCRLLR